MAKIFFPVPAKPQKSFSQNTPFWEKKTLASDSDLHEVPQQNGLEEAVRQHEDAISSRRNTFSWDQRRRAR